MITFFSTPKPFRGHIGVIQRNAIQSWMRVRADAEVILFGDDKGAAEVAREFGIRHVPQVERNEFGTKYLASIFDQANDLARYELLCYVNCDIVFTEDFAAALERVAAWSRMFLMVGRRWDTDITAPLDFAQRDWSARARTQALTANRPRSSEWIDYFAFSRGLYPEIPPLVIGRVAWDRWLVRAARSAGAPVVDASDVVVAVHQNHDYGYHPAGVQGVWNDEQAQRNFALAGPARNLHTIDDATHRLTAEGMRWNPRHLLLPAMRAARPWLMPLWHGLLNLTRPLRHRVGLRQDKLERLAGRPR